MLSIRTFARSAPRALSRMTAASLRQPAIARPSTLVKPATTAVVNSARPAAFSTTSGRWASESEVDEELSAKLDSEIQIEEDMKTTEQEPASVKDFLANSPFELVDTPGQEIVKLVRSFGEEKVTVSFSIADITNYDPYAQDPALEDEEGFAEDPNKQASSQSNSNPEEEEEAGDEVDEAPAPINLSILIEKPGKTAGALTIDATAQNGNIVVDNLYFYDDVKVARIDTPEAAQQRADLYPGPPFGSLDDDLQVLMERFLEERGITQTLGVFVPDYVDVKEQREYLRWLSNVKNFVDA